MIDWSCTEIEIYKKWLFDFTKVKYNILMVTFPYSANIISFKENELGTPPAIGVPKLPRNVCFTRLEKILPIDVE